jgi:hypothetical protein
MAAGADDCTPPIGSFDHLVRSNTLDRSCGSVGCFDLAGRVFDRSGGRFGRFGGHFDRNSSRINRTMGCIDRTSG